MPTTTSPRAAALQILLEHRRRGTYLNIALDAYFGKHSYSLQEKAFLTALVMGVTERRITLEYQLTDLLNRPLKKLLDEIQIVLLLGLYQIYYMDGVPERAAISESVDLVRTGGRRGAGSAPWAAGLVNAVLRRAAGRQLQYPDRETDEVGYLSVKYAVQPELASLWRGSYPGKYEEILSALALPADTVLRVNTQKTSPAALAEKLAAYGAQRMEGIPAAVLLPWESFRGDVTVLPGFREGLFHVQDGAAQLCCEALGAKPGETVFDLCAAPGGKSFTLAQTVGAAGKVLAFDLYPQRVQLIREGASRLGLENVEAYTEDAAKWQELAGKHGKALRILCDVPCSGLGILRKKADIREKFPKDLDELPKTQYNIVESACACLADTPGASLLYCTCTLNPKENEEVADRLLAMHPEFREDLRRTIFPGRGLDGFFMARFVRAGH
ncbi:MAG: 16S rRNA (cytosine(967)-C(5))-methyltransferase RsmB [Oscillospiraceae bacterium]|jgi:16S rRNA (cytosine967-C5)-methyltransferase|nr:16S rRNA (cytosine(967)-C(5))-methyltransferase RsmB [Oscillospiraceae bacterium]